jgi:hypothetical protein
MIYKQCIDACFDCVKACDRLSVEGCEKTKECLPGHCHSIRCAEVCNLVGRLTAKGICPKDMYELCAKVSDECAKKCEGIDNEYGKACLESCKKCAEACRTCHEDTKKSDTTGANGSNKTC